MMACALCREDGGEVLWRDDTLRVVLVTTEADYPGFCRVIWHAHAAELTDLDEVSRARLMHVVCAVERAVRAVMQPAKVNLASLGNQVPHLHWHVIPRFTDDPHFPQPIWGSRQRTVSAALVQSRCAQAAQLGDAVRAALSSTPQAEPS